VTFIMRTARTLTGQIDETSIATILRIVSRSDRRSVGHPTDGGNATTLVLIMRAPTIEIRAGKKTISEWIRSMLNAAVQQ